MTHTATFNPSWPTHMVIINAHNHPVIGNWNVIFVNSACLLAVQPGHSICAYLWAGPESKNFA